MVCSLLKIKYKSPLVCYVFLFNFFFEGEALKPVASQQWL